MAVRIRIKWRIFRQRVIRIKTLPRPEAPPGAIAQAVFGGAQEGGVEVDEAEPGGFL